MRESRPRTRAFVTDGQWPPQLASLGARIVELRQKQGPSQAELAERANLSRPTISKIERDVQDVGTVALLRIAEVLNVTMGDLFD